MTTERKTMPRANQEQAREFWEWVHSVGGFAAAAIKMGITYQAIYALTVAQKPPTMKMWAKYKTAATSAQ